VTSTHTAPQKFVDRVVQVYGDLLFDLCESVLWSPSSAQVAFRAILKELRKSESSEPYVDYERAWVLKVACTRLRSYAENHGRRLTPSEQVMLDATLSIPARLKEFDSYFHRLPTEDQILLLLRDKYGLPYQEISAAMGLPEGSLKLRRQQSLRTLEEWLWDQT
jgi:DNA-directed RNA polymerase specialized sigma24 family protein